MKTPVLSVIERYIGKEVFLAFLAVFLVLFIIFVSAFLVRALTDASLGVISNELIFTHMGLRLARFTSFLMPFSLYLAVVLVLTRLYQDNEAVALFACGVGYGKFYRAISLVAFPLMVVTGWLSLQAGPLSAQIEYNLLKASEQDLEVTGISPQKFREVSGGERVMYVEKVTDEGKRTEKVFIYAKVHKRTVLFSAETARIENNEIGERFLILENGYRYDYTDHLGADGKPDVIKECLNNETSDSKNTCSPSVFRITQYKEHTVKLISKLRNEEGLRQNVIPTKELLVSKRPHEIGEFQWRVAQPIFLLVLMLFAVPISKVHPRHGRYLNIVFAIIIFASYFLFQYALNLSLARRAILPAGIGWWLAHVLMLVATVVLLLRQHGLRWTLNPFGRLRK